MILVFYLFQPWTIRVIKIDRFLFIKFTKNIAITDKTNSHLTNWQLFFVMISRYFYPLVLVNFILVQFYFMKYTTNRRLSAFQGNGFDTICLRVYNFFETVKDIVKISDQV